MSKSKGNVVDPLVVIDQYGADALRFTLARVPRKFVTSGLVPPGREQQDPPDPLWNAVRFA